MPTSQSFQVAVKIRLWLWLNFSLGNSNFAPRSPEKINFLQIFSNIIWRLAAQLCGKNYVIIADGNEFSILTIDAEEIIQIYNAGERDFRAIILQ
jgi:hypothetical protein